MATKRVHVCTPGCSDYAPCLYSEACRYSSIVLFSDKDVEVDFLLSILLNCQKRFVLGSLTVVMAKKQISLSH